MICFILSTNIELQKLGRLTMQVHGSQYWYPKQLIQCYSDGFAALTAAGSVSFKYAGARGQTKDHNAQSVTSGFMVKALSCI